MLALAVMPVVFVLDEPISLGTQLAALRRSNRLSPLGYASVDLKSATVTEFSWKREKWNAVNPSS